MTHKHIGSEVILYAKGLALSYGSTKVLEIAELKLEGERGLVIGLQGPNGTGKSTLLKACLGLHKPSAGRISLLGAIPGTKDFRKTLARVGYVPQARPAGVLRLTVKEVVESGRYGRIGFLGKSGDRDRQAIAVAMEETGIVNLANRAIQELSGGQYQRVQIARALASEPELIVLDEPDSHLDAEGRAGVIKILSTLTRKRKSSMLIVSHDEELLELSDAILFFSNGHVEFCDA